MSRSEDDADTIEVTDPMTQAEIDLLSVPGAAERLVDGLARSGTSSSPRRSRRQTPL